MAVINFPSSPNTNDTYTFEGRTWVYTGYGWRIVTQVAGEKGQKGERVSYATFTDANNTLTFTNSDNSEFYASGVKGNKGQKGELIASGVFTDANNTTTFTHTDGSTFHVNGLKGDKGQKGERVSSASSDGTTITFTNSDGSTFEATGGFKGQKGERVSSAIFTDANNTTEFTNSDGSTFDIVGLKGTSGERIANAVFTDANNTTVFTNTDNSTFEVTGLKGDKGEKGIKGDVEEKGNKGDKGERVANATFDGSIMTFTNSDDSTFDVAAAFKGQKGERVSSAIYTDANNTVEFTNSDGSTFDVYGVKGQKGQKGEKGERVANATFDGSTMTFTNSDNSTFDVNAAFKGQKGERVSNAVFTDANNTTVFTNTDGSTFDVTGVKGQKGEVGDLTGIGLFSETLTPITGATGTVSHDLSLSGVFYHSSISSNFTANFINVADTNNRTKVVSLICFQGSTAYIPSAVQIDGSAQTIKWFDGLVPFGTSNGIDIFTFALIRANNTWYVAGNLTGFE